MTKKGKYFLITIISIIMLITTFLGIGLQSAFAFSGIPNTLTEQESLKTLKAKKVSILLTFFVV